MSSRRSLRLRFLRPAFPSPHPAQVVRAGHCPTHLRNRVRRTGFRNHRRSEGLDSASRDRQGAVAPPRAVGPLPDGRGSAWVAAEGRAVSTLARIFRRSSWSRSARNSGISSRPSAPNCIFRHFSMPSSSPSSTPCAMPLSVAFRSAMSMNGITFSCWSASIGRVVGALNGTVRQADRRAGIVIHSRIVQTWSARPAAIAGDRCRTRPVHSTSHHPESLPEYVVVSQDEDAR